MERIAKWWWTVGRQFFLSIREELAPITVSVKNSLRPAVWFRRVNKEHATGVLFEVSKNLLDCM